MKSKGKCNLIVLLFLLRMIYSFCGLKSVLEPFEEGFAVFKADRNSDQGGGHAALEGPVKFAPVCEKRVRAGEGKVGAKRRAFLASQSVVKGLGRGESFEGQTEQTTKAGAGGHVFALASETPGVVFGRAELGIVNFVQGRVRVAFFVVEEVVAELFSVVVDLFDARQKVAAVALKEDGVLVVVHVFIRIRLNHLEVRVAPAVRVEHEAVVGRECQRQGK